MYSKSSQQQILTQKNHLGWLFYSFSTAISEETLILLYGNQKLIITFVGKEEKGI
jgi:hypothetical protein